MEAKNPNTVGTGALSPASNLVIFGKLPMPKAPVLEWKELAGAPKTIQGVATGFMELRFEAITVPADASPIYEYQLYNATGATSAAIGGWERIYLQDNAGDGSEAKPYKIYLMPSPGRYTATLRARTELGASATSDESGPSAAEVMGEQDGCGCRALMRRRVVTVGALPPLQQISK